MSGASSNALRAWAAWTVVSTAGCTLLAPLDVTGGADVGVTGTAGPPQADAAGGVPPRPGGDDASGAGGPGSEDGGSLTDAAPSVVDSGEPADSAFPPADDAPVTGDDAAAGDDAS